jgi:hypothetical protein
MAMLAKLGFISTPRYIFLRFNLLVFFSSSRSRHGNSATRFVAVMIRQHQHDVTTDNAIDRMKTNFVCAPRNCDVSWQRTFHKREFLRYVVLLFTR